MRTLFIELLTAHTAGTVGDTSLFTGARELALGMDKTLNTVAARSEAREFAMRFCQTVKNTNGEFVVFTYPDGTRAEFATQALLIADCTTNFATYFPSIVD